MAGSLAYVHTAELILGPEADERAPGGAVTIALCGHWNHDGDCRWPHHASVSRTGGALDVRVEFTCRPEEEAQVRALIEGALAAGVLAEPAATWTLVRQGRPTSH